MVAPVHYTKTAAHWFDPSAFAAPAPLVFGDSARNLIYGPGLFNWDVSPFKSFLFGREGTNFEFRAETYNVFNDLSFNSINNNFSNGSQYFGQCTSIHEPPILQFRGSFHF